MSTPQTGLYQFISLLGDCISAHTLKKVVCSKPRDNTVMRAVWTLRTVGKTEAVQAETFRTDHKAVHENLATGDTSRMEELLLGFGQIDLITSAGNATLLLSARGKQTVIGLSALQKAMGAGDTPTVATEGNDRKKQYILSGDEPFLKLLGISGADGRVHDKRQPKFRQINRFLELVRDIVPMLPKDGTLRICDLCCGKSYLSFAVYHYFANILHRDVRMTGVDLKRDVIEDCSEIAKTLGFAGLEFLYGDVGTYDAGEHVHLVVSLHACDIATDLVLQKAVDWNADVILSTPCCQHELNHILQCPELGFLAEHSMLRQKFCEAATDAMRLKRLEAHGYRVAALELIDPEETPKNILLRATRRKGFRPDSEEAKRLLEEYEAAKQFLVRGQTKYRKTSF